LNKLAQMTEGFVGEEIGHIVVSGLFEAFYEDRGLTSYDLEKSIQSTVPLSVTKSEQIRGIRAWASTRAVVATFRNNRKEYNNFTEESSDIIASRGGSKIDEMNINIEYYKNMKNSGVDYDSRVGYRFTVDLKIQKIKAESVEGTN